MTAKEFPWVIQVRDNNTNAVLGEIRTRDAGLALQIANGYFDRLKTDVPSRDVKITDEVGGAIHAPIAA